MQVRETITDRASVAGISLSSDELDNLSTFFELLRRWNRKVSLTALPVEEAGNEAIDRLLIEPILAARHLEHAVDTILDVGSGSGSPAIPLKLVRPSIFLRMVESRTRKVAFLREAIRVLGVERADVAPVRYQELLGDAEAKNKVDVVMVRAVRLDRRALLDLRLFLKPNGSLFLFRSAGAKELELEESSLTHQSIHVLLGGLGSQLEIVRNVGP